MKKDNATKYGEMIGTIIGFILLITSMIWCFRQDGILAIIAGIFILEKVVDNYYRYVKKVIKGLQNVENVETDSKVQMGFACKK